MSQHPTALSLAPSAHQKAQPSPRLNALLTAVLGFGLAVSLVSGPAFAAPLGAPTISEDVLVHEATEALHRIAPVTAGMSHEVQRVTPWKAGTRVRFEPRFDGLRVLGADRLVSLDQRGVPTNVLARTLGVASVPQSTPSLSSGEAKANAHALLATFYGHRGELWPARSELVYVATKPARGDSALRLVWLVDVSFSEPLAIYQVAIDAHTGAIHGHRPTLFEARANVYPTNPSISDVEEVELLGLYSGATELTGTYGRVVSCDELDDGGFGGGVTCTEKSHHAEADSEGDFLFEPDPGSSDDPFAEAQMYYHLDLVARWFDEEQGFDHDYPTEAVVNFDYNNAFFGDIDGDGLGEIAFGQSGTMDFAYDADVVYHEFGHSVFGRIAGQTGFAGADEYGMEWATGGLNEGTADLFSLVLTDDPRLGEYAASGFGLGAAIRDLEEDRHCPTDLYGESHRDGEVFGSFGWNLIENPEFGAALTGDYIYGAVAAFPSDASWADAGEALVNTAAEMLEAGQMTEKQHAIVTAELAASGLDNCGRVIPLDDGQEPTLLMNAVSLFSDTLLPVGNQFSLDAPEGTYRLRFRVKEFLANDPNLAWTLHVRRGEHIVHALEDLQTPFGNFVIPVPDLYDFAIEGEGDDFELIIDEDSDYPLEPGATYYFSLASRQDGALANFLASGEIRVDGDAYIDEDAIDNTDENDGDESNSDNGCACAQAQGASGGTSLSLAMLLVLVGLTRRGRGGAAGLS